MLLLKRLLILIWDFLKFLHQEHRYRGFDFNLMKRHTHYCKPPPPKPKLPPPNSQAPHAPPLPKPIQQTPGPSLFAILPKYWNQSLGSQLLLQFLTIAGEAGLPVWTFTTPGSHNLYLRFGLRMWSIGIMIWMSGIGGEWDGGAFIGIMLCVDSRIWRRRGRGVVELVGRVAFPRGQLEVLISITWTII